MSLPLVIGAALVAVGALRTLSKPSNHAAGKFVGVLRNGGLFRARFRVLDPIALTTPEALSSVIESVAHRLEAIGFSPVYVVTPDPTSPGVFSAVARWNRPETEVYDGSGIDLFMVDAVEEPPASTFQPPEPLACLDAGLSFDEQRTIAYALAHDDDSKHLTGFAWTLEPDFPVAASLLRAKARLAEMRMGAAAITDEQRRAHATQLRERFTKAFATAGWSTSFDPEANAPLTAEWLKSATQELKGVPEAFAKYETTLARLGPLAGAHVPGVQAWLFEGAVKSAAQAPHEAAGLALADQAKPGMRALHDYFFMTKGQTLADRGAHLTSAAQRGPSVRVALLADLAVDVQREGGPVGLKRAIVAILDRRGLLLLPPPTVAKQLGVSVAVARAAQASIRVLPGEILVVEPDVIRSLDPAGALVARPTGVLPTAENVAHLAPSRRDMPLSATPSTAAIQLVHATSRPELSGALSPETAIRRVMQVHAGAAKGDRHAKRAQESLDQAQKLLQRQKWIAWYRRIREAGGSKVGPSPVGGVPRLTGRLDGEG